MILSKVMKKWLLKNRSSVVASANATDQLILKISWRLMRARIEPSHPRPLVREEA